MKNVIINGPINDLRISRSNFLIMRYPKRNQIKCSNLMPVNKEPKLMLSAHELNLLNNRDWILTKRVVIDKINELLGDLAARQKNILLNHADILPKELFAYNAKISKGENYLQFPFLILDYPRYFKDENIFAVRTMFWWANFFSVTIHLSGAYKQKYQQSLLSNYNEIKSYGYFVNVHQSQWHHYFEEDNYKAVNEISKEEFAIIIEQKKFIKLAARFPLQQWQQIPLLLEKTFTHFFDMLQNQLPNR